MKRKLLLTTLLIGCFMVCLAMIADISGKWSGTFNAPDGNQYPLTYSFKLNGGSLTGTLDAGGMTVPIDSGIVKDDAVSFSVSVQGVTYTHKGKYFAAGDSIALDVTFAGNKSHLQLKRAP